MNIMRTILKKMPTKIILFLLLLIGIFIVFFNPFQSKLKSLGYSQEEINIINKKLNKTELTFLYSIPYNSKYILLINEDNYPLLTSFINNENYDALYLEEYYNYYKNNSSFFPDKIINNINNYNSLKQKGYNEEESLAIVNTLSLENINGLLVLDINKYILEIINDENFDSVIAITKRPQYLTYNTKRYYDYLVKNPSFSLDYIISLVNCNRDYAYYSNMKESDLSKNELVLVNKYYKLSSTYVPEGLVQIAEAYGGCGQYISELAYNSYIEMYLAMKEEGLEILATSGYRSYQTQVTVYNYYFSIDGYRADTYSARPGSSEHQTGLAIDIGRNNAYLNDFKYTKEYTWLINNSYKYGFIIRYPEGKTDITGYSTEYWHYRYVGVEVAKEIYNGNITFDEYYAYYIEKSV